MNSNVIYKYKCNICNDVYIGETKRHLLFRQYQHLGRSILTEKPLKYNEKDATAVRKNCHCQKIFVFSYLSYLSARSTLKKTIRDILPYVNLKVVLKIKNILKSKFTFNENIKRTAFLTLLQVSV